MRRGTTPTFVFTLPFDMENVKTVEITYAQGGCIKVQKTLEDAAVDGRKIVVDLTQEETFRFEVGLADVQARVLTATGKVPPSNIVKIFVEPSLSEVVLK